MPGVAWRTRPIYLVKFGEIHTEFELHFGEIFTKRVAGMGGRKSSGKTDNSQNGARTR
jgi:hypothetical protein